MSKRRDQETRPTQAKPFRDPTSQRPTTPAKLFQLSLGSAAVGGLLFGLGTGIAFTPGQSGGSGLMMIGALLIGLGAIGNIPAFAWGLYLYAVEGRASWWLILSLLGLAATAMGANVLLNL